MPVEVWAPWLPAALAAATAWAALGLVLALVNLARIPRLPAGGGSSRAPVKVSVVIPVRNEQRDVEAAIRSHLAQDYPDLEVVAVEDRSTDDSPRILERLSREDARVRIVRGGEPPPGWLGKPHALAQGAAAALGEILLFADADVRYARGALSRAVSLLQRDEIDFLCLLPRIEARGFWENVLMPNLIVTFFTGPAFLIAAPGWKRVAAGGGAGNLVRRAAYDSAGGHATLRASVIDDIRLAYLLKAAGARVAVARAEDAVAVRMYRGFREVFNGFTKNAAYIYRGWPGVILFALTLATLGLAILPAAALLGAAVGVPIRPWAAGLAAAALGLAIATRLLLAVALRDPLWPAFTHPIMAAVWSGILARSLFHRFVLRRLTWRGRRFDAREARF